MWREWHDACVRAWVNGKVLDDPTGPAVAVSDHGLTVGDGVFEAIKAVEGRPFALGRHLERLEASAEGLGLPAPNLQEVRRGVAAVLLGTSDPLSRIRITYTAGPAPLGSGRSDGEPTLIVVAAPLDEAAESSRVATVPWPRNERGALAGLKTTSYAENVVMLAYAKARGAGEAVMANLAGHLCEGTGTNVFYVVDGELRTPSLESGCLAGVTRALVLEWYGGREVDEPIEMVQGGQRGLPRLDHPRRTAGQPLGRPRAAGAGSDHQGRPGGLARARGDDAGGARLMG